VKAWLGQARGAAPLGVPEEQPVPRAARVLLGPHLRHGVDVPRGRPAQGDARVPVPHRQLLPGDGRPRPGRHGVPRVADDGGPARRALRPLGLQRHHAGRVQGQDATTSGARCFTSSSRTARSGRASMASRQGLAQLPGWRLAAPPPAGSLPRRRASCARQATGRTPPSARGGACWVRTSTARARGTRPSATRARCRRSSAAPARWWIRLRTRRRSCRARSVTSR
jgi:hypothetical protein